MRRALLTSVAFAVCAGLAVAQGKVLATLDEAFRGVFPDCVVERTTVYLTPQEQARIAELSGTPFDRAVVYPYVARRAVAPQPPARDARSDSRPVDAPREVVVGTAYLDNHRVRTLRETLMVVVAPAGTIDRVEVLAFGEPLDYLPRAKWYSQFERRALDSELNVKHGIDGVSGATLTVRATTDCARRVLALHQVIAERTPAGRVRRTPSGTPAGTPDGDTPAPDDVRTGQADPTATTRRSNARENRSSDATRTIGGRKPETDRERSREDRR